MRTSSPFRFRPPAPAHFFYLGLAAGLFCIFFAVTNPGYLDISDAQERFSSILALLQTGSPAINSYFHPTMFMPIYSFGPALSALPFLGWADLLVTWWCHLPARQVWLWAALISVKVYTALWMAVVAAIAYHYVPGRRLSFLVALVAGLTTLVLPYTRTFQSENLAGLGVACVLLGFLRFHRHQALKWLAFAGFSYGMLLTIKPETSIGIPMFAGWLAVVCRRHRHRLWPAFRKWIICGVVMGVSMLPGALVILWYNWVRYGTPWLSGYESQGFTFPFLSGLYLQWLSAGKGLVWYCPVLLFTLCHTRSWLKRFGPDAWLPLLWWLMMTCLYAKWHSPPGETSLGSRFMVSYLPIGILPLTALGRFHRRRDGISPEQSSDGVHWNPVRAILFGFTALVSFAVSLFLCAVPFVLYHSHRWNNAPNNIIDRMRVVWEDWYVPPYSPLNGLQALFKKGILDLFFIRDMPVEQHIFVHPGLWYWLAGAVGFLGFTWIYAGRLDRSESGIVPRPTGNERILGGIVILFVGILAFAGISRAGSGRTRGFHVTFHRPGWAEYETRSMSIDVDDFQDSAVFHVVGAADFYADYTGTIKIHEPGHYRFRLKTGNFATLLIDGKSILRVRNRPYKPFQPAFVSLDLTKGIHHFDLHYYQFGVWGGLELKWKRPQDSWFRSLRSADPHADD